MCIRQRKYRRDMSFPPVSVPTRRHPMLPVRREKQQNKYVSIFDCYVMPWWWRSSRNASKECSTNTSKNASLTSRNASVTSKNASGSSSMQISPTTEQFPEEQTEPKLTTVHIERRPNTTVGLHVPIQLKSLSWRIEGPSWVTETRTFYLLTTRGEFVFLQLAYTCSGWPVQSSCQVTARYFDPSNPKDVVDKRWKTNLPLRKGRGRKDPERGADRHVVECTNHAAIRMRLSEDHTGIMVNGSGVHLVGPNGNSRQQVMGAEKNHQNDRNGVRGCYRGALLDIDFIFEPICQGASFGDGNISFGVDGGDGTINMKFLPCGVARGTVTVDSVPKPLSAHGIMLHQFQGIRPNLVASHWHLGVFVSDADSAGETTSTFMIQISTPGTYGSATVNYGGLYGDGRLLALCRNGRIVHTRPDRDSHSGYYIPATVTLEWHGITVDGDAFRASAAIQPQVLCERMNLLEQLPFVMRKIVETFVTRPYVYQWVDRAELTMTMRGNKASIQGWMMTEMSFLGDD
jgi:hypothetical protein